VFPTSNGAEILQMYGLKLNSPVNMFLVFLFCRFVHIMFVINISLYVSKRVYLFHKGSYTLMLGNLLKRLVGYLLNNLTERHEIPAIQLYLLT
jgi:hypothetical protein